MHWLSVSPVVRKSVLLALIAALAVASGVGLDAGRAAVPSQAIELPEGFEESVVASGLSMPTALAKAPDGRIFVAERSGTLRVIKDGVLLPTPFLQVPVSVQGERGLVGVALDPDFETNGYVYIYYTMTGGAAGSPDERGITHLSRFTASRSNPDVAEPGSEVVLMELPNFVFHNSGGMHFGPDGMLYFGLGDNNIRETAQSVEAITGKIHRIDASNYPDIIPDDNPFVNTPGAEPSIWAYGLRNPFTFAIDPETGRILVNDVGDAGWEEINEIEKGKNYGWPVCEGPNIRGRPDPCGIEDFTPPLYTYPHMGPAPLTGCSIIGGGFYKGNRFPAEYRDNYFFSDYCGQWIARLDPQGNVTQFAQFTSRNRFIGGMMVQEDGIYFSSMQEGTVYRISYTGLVAQASASPAEGNAPLEVQFSAAGSNGPDGAELSFDWDFGDGTTGSGESVTHTYAEEGRYEVVLTVSANGATATETIEVSVGTRPTVRIRPDGPEAALGIGDTVELIGEAQDGSGRTLPAAAFTWEVSLHDGQEIQPIGEPVTGTNRVELTIPGDRKVPPDAFYRVMVTAEDAAGLRGTATYDIRLRPAAVTFQTDPAGLNLVVDGHNVTAPHTQTYVAGDSLRVQASPLQALDGRFYQFREWTGANVAGDALTVPAQDTTVTAVYEEVDAPAPPEGSLVIYDDTLHWSNSSWGTELNPENPSPVFEGQASMEVDYTTSWAGLRFVTDPVNTSPFTHLQFAIRPGEWGLPKVRVAFYGRSNNDEANGEEAEEEEDDDGQLPARVDIGPFAQPIGGGWYLVNMPLSILEADDTTITGFVIQDDWGIEQPVFYVDSVRLVSLPDLPMPSLTPTPTATPSSESSVALRPAPPVDATPTPGTPGAPGAPDQGGGGNGSAVAGEGSSRQIAMDDITWLALPAAVAVVGASAFAIRRRKAGKTGPPAGPTP